MIVNMTFAEDVKAKLTYYQDVWLQMLTPPISLAEDIQIWYNNCLRCVDDKNREAAGSGLAGVTALICVSFMALGSTIKVKELKIDVTV